MQETKIEWCDATWNPVTGCLHGCGYCYARGIARRFGGGYWSDCHYTGEYWECNSEGYYEADGTNHVLDEPLTKWTEETGENESQEVPAPYPFYFDPTFHRYRLREPQTWGQLRTVFVCSMADLFGEWVPDGWIKEVFAACAAAPQHRYVFLTKNPGRYKQLAEQGKLPKEHWYGSTITSHKTLFFHASGYRTFLSIEPLLDWEETTAPNPGLLNTDWIIIGAESGNRKGKAVPRKEWVDDICHTADFYGRIPVFMKESLVPIVGEENMRRELPWEARRAYDF
jgi:protein gp37